jgi:hypothetical protein
MQRKAQARRENSGSLRSNQSSSRRPIAARAHRSVSLPEIYNYLIESEFLDDVSLREPRPNLGVFLEYELAETGIVAVLIPSPWRLRFIESRHNKTGADVAAWADKAVAAIPKSGLPLHPKLGQTEFEARPNLIYRMSDVGLISSWDELDAATRERLATIRALGIVQSSLGSGNIADPSGFDWKGNLARANQDLAAEIREKVATAERVKARRLQQIEADAFNLSIDEFQAKWGFVYQSHSK